MVPEAAASNAVWHHPPRQFMRNKLFRGYFATLARVCDDGGRLYRFLGQGRILFSGGCAGRELNRGNPLGDFIRQGGLPRRRDETECDQPVSASLAATGL